VASALLATPSNSKGLNNMSRKHPIVRYEVVIDYQWNARGKWEHHYSCVVRDHEANDVYGVISFLSDYSWLEQPKLIDIKFVGKDAYIVTVKTTKSYLNAVRIKIRHPMSVS